jgi:uncharacterized protein (TIGR01777 family)
MVEMWQKKSKKQALLVQILGQLCKKWEDAAEGALCRTVKLRIGIVLGKGGGALPQLVGLHQKYIGGRIASGKQGISWIHIEDLIRAIRFVMDNSEISGPVNLTSPNWVTQSVFAKSIDKAIGKKNLFFIPKFALDIVLGERAIIVWGGQKVRPQRLMAVGFTCNFTEIDHALEDLLTIKEG